MSSTSFQIYNASAGSGKTHTLVKEYLKILLSDDLVYHVKQVLAVTFTNKAVYEMKERVILNLRAFSDSKSLNQPTAMMISLSEELNESLETINQRAGKALKHILHNYAFFDIVTIDKFNHRIIRTFAYDLKIPSNFEVALDTAALLEEAVDKLMHKAGEDKLLTKALVDFAMEKADEDKSWDISTDLRKIAQLLLQENHYEHVEQLKTKTLHDFLLLGQSLKAAVQQQEKIIKAGAESVLQLIEANNLEPSDFIRATLPNHFKKMAALDLRRLYDNKLEENLSEGKLYTKTLPEDKALAIDSLLPELSGAYHRLKKAVFHVKFLRNFYSNIVPLSLLNAIRNELETIKAEQNVVLISEFNSIISKAIANQPAPFIYERLGEKYRHYFIDEFQDTSRMQWENLKPLISNALESETLYGKRGTLCIVGDAKQAIYRWRGGMPEQFIDLYRDNNPFQVEKEVVELPKNRRSFSEIVAFNNGFFGHIASFLTQSDYRDLYKNKSFQETGDKQGGMVCLSFLEKEANDEDYCEKTLQHIRETVSQGFAYHDICVLTRKRKEGVTVAAYLLEYGVKIVSSETLLLKNNPKIGFIIDLMHTLLQPKPSIHRANMLYFLAEKEQPAEKHDFLVKYLNDLNAVLVKYDFDASLFPELPFFDAVEYAVNAFGLADDSDAYLQYFLDEIMDFVLKEGGGISHFLSWWDKKKDSLSIVAPQVPDAVQIMTIHKAKGLEFPVVIYPFATTSIYDERQPKIWFPLEDTDYGIPYALLNKNKDMSHISDAAAGIYNDFQSKLELDQFNILYVALTRAVERLYIITKKDTDRKGEEKWDHFSGLFINYLKSKMLWDDVKTDYVFGKAVASSSESNGKYKLEALPFTSYPMSGDQFKMITTSGILWDTSRERLIERNRLFRHLLAQITYAEDVPEVIQGALESGTITPGEKTECLDILNAVVHHNILAPYYTSSYTIYKDREVYSRSGAVIKPERLAVQDNKAIIIACKTGAFNDNDAEKLRKQAGIIEEMQLVVEHMFQVCINDTVEVTEV